MRTNRIYPVQIMTITISAMLGVHILTIQYNAVYLAGRDAWISMLLAGIITLVWGIVFSFPLAQMYPETPIPDILIMEFGKVFGRIALFFIMLHVLVEAGLSLRIFVQALKVFLLERTPVYALVILVAVGVISVAKRGVNAIAASVDFMFPIFILPIVILIILPATQLRTEYIMPVFYHNTGNVLKGLVPIFEGMVGFNGVLYYLSNTLGPRNAKKWYISAIIIAVFLYTSLTLVCIMTFGSEDLLSMVYPSLNLARSIVFPLVFLERLEALIITIWIPGVFAWLVLFTDVSTRNITTFFNIKSRGKGYVVYAHIVLLSVIALIPQRDLEALRYFDVVSYAGIALSYIFIPALYIIAFIKRRRHKGK